MVIASIDPDPAKAQALKDWRRAYWTAIHPFNLEDAYVNFMMDDPKNLFRVNQNIRPAT